LAQQTDLRKSLAGASVFDWDSAQLKIMALLAVKIIKI